MIAAALPSPFERLAPDLARRLGVILANLAALIARRFLREPRLVGLTVPLWNRLNRAARRFDRLMARVAAGRRPRSGKSGRGGPAAIRLPQGRAWLVRALGHEAAAFGSQLQFLLSEPGVADLLAATPAAGRILRPLARMLGVDIPPAATAPDRRPPIRPDAGTGQVSPPSPGAAPGSPPPPRPESTRLRRRPAR